MANLKDLDYTYLGQVFVEIDNNIDTQNLSYTYLGQFYTLINNAVLKYWNGASWVSGKPVKYWSGATWVAKKFKYYTGTFWRGVD